MHPVSQMIIQQASGIEGYSPEMLLDDLLKSRVKLVNYSIAAREFNLKPGTIAMWVYRGVIKRYGTGGGGARVNLYEVANVFLNPPKESGTAPRKRRKAISHA